MNKPTAIVLVGVGNIGQYWLEHYAGKPWPNNSKVALRALFNSSKQLLISRDYLEQIEQPLASLFARRAHPCRNIRKAIQQTVEFLAKEGQVIVVDVTASKTVSRYYLDWLKAGADIVSANKFAGSSATDYYQKLQRAITENGGRWRASTTVGAGLPIQAMIREQHQQGLPIARMEGNFSGSLSWIFAQYKPGDTLSDWLLKATDLGLLEPDPRSDLSGMDVARKLLIMARDAGWQTDLPAMHIHNLVPPALRQISVDEFWRRIDEFDHHFESWRLQHAPTAQRFCYLGSMQHHADGVTASAQLEAVPADSGYAQLAPTETLFQLYPHADSSEPLQLQGPGSGREVTAAGIQADILALLGSR